MAIYVKIDGIDGDATHDKHKSWLDVESLQWGVGRAVMTPSGSAQNREASEPAISEVTLTKKMDRASANLFKEACTGNAGKKVTIDLVTTSSPGLTYMTYELTNALVSGYSVSTGGDRPSESVSLNFTKIEMKYTTFDSKNNPAQNYPASYDLSTTKSS
jgi:type VI secretion system secreted protein Hcp